MVTPSNSIAAQQIATLTASVQAGGQPVTVGTVNFFDGKLYLRSVQVVRDASHGYAVGTATWKLALSVGTHSITATFLPTATLASSTSTSQTLTVSSSGATTGPGTTNLILSNVVAPIVGETNLLTATLTTSGANKPTGSIVFSNQTSNTALGTFVVNPSSFKAGFAPVASVPAVFPQQIYSADFNGDGLPDFLSIVGDTTPTEVLQPYLNGGDGTFRAAAPIVTPLPYSGTAPLSSEAALSPTLGTDFNGDGVPDLAFQSSATTISVLMGAGDGTFPFTETLTIPSGGSTSYFEAVAIGDFNGDGIPDLMATNVVYTSTGGSIVVNIFPGKGDGTFGSPITSTSVDGFSALVQDFNQDGFADLVIVPNEQKVVLIQLGNGDGTFQPAVSYPVGTSPMLGTALQSRGNGITDLAIWNTGDSTISILLGKGDGTFVPQPTIPYQALDTELMQAIAADVTGDGLQDMVVLLYPDPQEPPSPQTFNVYAGNGDGTYQAPVTYNFLPNTLLTQPFSLTAGDFNHDGVADIGLSDDGNGLLEALSLSLQGSPLFSASFPLTTTVYGPSGSIQQVAANYSGDSNNSAAVSNLVAVQGNSNPNLRLSTIGSELTIAAGQTATATISVVPLFGFSGSVQLSCSGLPANSTCSFSPSSVTVNGVAANTTLTIATNVQSAANELPAHGLRGSFVSFAILLGFGSLVGIRRSGEGAGKCSSARRCWQWLFFAATLALALGSPLGCRSGTAGSGGSGGNPSTPVTPAGISTVTVKAVSSGSTPITATLDFEVTVTK